MVSKVPIKIPRFASRKSKWIITIHVKNTCQKVLAKIFLPFESINFSKKKTGFYRGTRLIVLKIVFREIGLEVYYSRLLIGVLKRFRSRTTRIIGNNASFQSLCEYYIPVKSALLGGVEGQGGRGCINVKVSNSNVERRVVQLINASTVCCSMQVLVT